MPDTEATRTPNANVRHVRAASRAELERRVLTLQPAHDALLAAAERTVDRLDPDGLVLAVSDASGGAGLYGQIVRDLRAAIAAASEAGS